MMSVWLYEYEDLLGDLIGSEERGPWDAQHLPGLTGGKGPVTDRHDPAWARLEAIMRSRGLGNEEAISDSESIVSIGDLRDEPSFDEGEMNGDRDIGLDLPRHSPVSENENTWAVRAREAEILFEVPSADGYALPAPFAACVGVVAKVTAREGAKTLKLWQRFTTSTCHA
jgi:hypothetical protein